MIEYLVGIPQGRKEAFEKAVHRIKDARVLSVKTSRESVVKKHLRRHRRLLEKINKKRSREEQDGINLGYQILLEDVVKDRNKYKKDEPLHMPSAELTDERFRSLVTSLLERSKDAEPRLVDTVKDQIGWRGNPLDPKEAQALIYRYGLLDGEQRSQADTFRMMGYSPSSHSARSLLIQGVSKVKHALEKEGLFVISPQTSPFD